MSDAAEALVQARHDLGKYIALQTRWLPDDPSTEELRAALIADLRRTRSGGGVEEDAALVWARLRPGLAGFDLGRLDAQMERVREALPRLEQLEREELLGLAAVVREVGPELKRLGNGR